MKQLRPSPAMVVAVIALIAGLSGTAIGAKVLSKKQVVKIARKQANRVIDQRGLSPANFYLRFAVADTCTATEPCSTSATCDEGDLAVGGGYDLLPYTGIGITPDQTPRVYRDQPAVAGKNPIFELNRSWIVSTTFAEGHERTFAVCFDRP